MRPTSADSYLPAHIPTAGLIFTIFLLATGILTVGPSLDVKTCADPLAFPSLYGPTNINAQTANQGMAAGFNSNGTVTVLKWPRPSYYDQVRYHTTDRDDPFYGASRDSGIFLGLRIDDTVSWLRDWQVDQRYSQPLSDTVVTRYRSESRDITVTVRDVVAQDSDVLVRDITIEAPDRSNVSVVAYENINPTTTRIPGFPVTDWCSESTNTDTAQYIDEDLVLHTAQGTDMTSGEETSVAIAVGFRNRSHAHDVGHDSTGRCLTIPVIAEICLREGSPGVFERTTAGRMGRDRHTGHTAASIERRVPLDNGTGRSTLLIGAAATSDNVTRLIDSQRDRQPDSVIGAKEGWLADELDEAPMPDTNVTAVRQLARRAQATLLTSYDRHTGAIVASIATQNPYGQDWPRDGAYFNLVLDRVLGRHDMVRQRNLWYASLQEDANYSTPVTPEGHWSMAYYADGHIAGPIPWEIDQTGYMLWTFWDHYAVTGNRSYLRQIYPSINRAAEALMRCSNRNGRRCTTWEDDVIWPRSTPRGTALIAMGLEYAALAAEEMGDTDDAERYRARATALRDHADRYSWDPERNAYGPGHAEIVWPGCLPSNDSRRQAHLGATAASLRQAVDGERQQGMYEAKSVLALAAADSRPELVREAADWLANGVATDDTRIQGEAWERTDDGIRTTVSQPHIWSQTLSYLAALEAYPPAGYTSPLHCPGTG